MLLLWSIFMRKNKITKSYVLMALFFIGGGGDRTRLGHFKTLDFTLDFTIDPRHVLSTFEFCIHS